MSVCVCVCGVVSSKVRRRQGVRYHRFEARPHGESSDSLDAFSQELMDDEDYAQPIQEKNRGRGEND